MKDLGILHEHFPACNMANSVSAKIKLLVSLNEIELSLEDNISALTTKLLLVRKKLLHACHEDGECFRMALLEFRNCPRQNGFSPFMAFFGRRLKGKIPFIPKPLSYVENDSFSDIRLQQKE